MRNGVGVGRFNGVGVGRNFSFSALQLMQRPTPVRYGFGRRCNAQRHVFLALCTTMAAEDHKDIAERRHAAAREIPRDSQRISDRKFRIFFAAAFEIA